MDTTPTTSDATRREPVTPNESLFSDTAASQAPLTAHEGTSLPTQPGVDLQPVFPSASSASGFPETRPDDIGGRVMQGSLSNEMNTKSSSLGTSTMSGALGQSVTGIGGTEQTVPQGVGSGGYGGAMGSGETSIPPGSTSAGMSALPPSSAMPGTGMTDSGFGTSPSSGGLSGATTGGGIMTGESRIGTGGLSGTSTGDMGGMTGTSGLGQGVSSTTTSGLSTTAGGAGLSDTNRGVSGLDQGLSGTSAGGLGTTAGETGLTGTTGGASELSGRSAGGLGAESGLSGTSGGFGAGASTSRDVTMTDAQPEERTGLHTGAGTSSLSSAPATTRDIPSSTSATTIGTTALTETTPLIQVPKAPRKGTRAPARKRKEAPASTELPGTTAMEKPLETSAGTTGLATEPALEQAAPAKGRRAATKKRKTDLPPPPSTSERITRSRSKPATPSERVQQTG